MKHLIKEVSNLVGVSTNTIRSYERMGLIDIDKDSTTGYRYFKSEDINLLLRTRMYRGYGLSLQETGAALKCGSPAQAASLFEQRWEAMKKELRYQQYVYDRLEEYIEELRALELQQGKLVFRTRPAMIAVMYRKSSELFDNLTLKNTVAAWAEYLPLVQSLFCVKHEAISSTQSSMYMGLLIEEKDADFLGIALNEHTFLIPSHPCMYGVARYEINPPTGGSSFQQLLLQCKQFGLEVKGDVFGRPVISLQDEGAFYSYNEYWFPI